jgi:hypothetical protein
VGLEVGVADGDSVVGGVTVRAVGLEVGVADGDSVVGGVPVGDAVRST